MNPKLNAMLAQLPEADYQRLLPSLQLVSLLAGHTLYEPGQAIQSAYFPINTLLAIARQLRDGTSIDTCLIGAEGIMGLRGLLLTPSCQPQGHIYVSVSGLAYKMDIQHLREAIQASPVIHEMCLCARERNMMNMSIEVACCHFHSNEQRLAKWLLTRLDRQSAPIFKITHQALANSLGVRRESVTHALAKLQGLRFGRGQIEVVDRSALEGVCCECYGLQKAAPAALPAPPLRA